MVRIVPFGLRLGMNIAFRLIIGIMLCVSGVDKAIHPMQFANALSGYGWIPSSLTAVLVFGVAFVEVLLGCLLLCGFFATQAALGTVVLLCVYTLVLVVALYTGSTQHACGCFTISGSAPSWTRWITGGSTVSTWDPVRDLIFVAITLGIYAFNVPRAGLDGWWQRLHDEDMAQQALARKAAAQPAKVKGGKRKGQPARQSAPASVHRGLSAERVEWLLKRFNLLLAALSIGVASVGVGVVAVANLERMKNGPLVQATDYHPLRTKLPIGSIAPDFTLSASSGQSVRLRAERGHVVLLEFFALWCPYCRTEAPILDALDKKYRSAQFESLSIVASPYGRTFESSHFTNFSTFTLSDVRWFTHTYRVQHPVLIDPTFAVTNAYAATGFPLIYVIDRNGVIRNVFSGPTAAGTLEQAVQSLL